MITRVVEDIKQIMEVSLDAKILIFDAVSLEERLDKRKYHGLMPLKRMGRKPKKQLGSQKVNQVETSYIISIEAFELVGLVNKNFM